MTRSDRNAARLHIVQAVNRFRVAFHSAHPYKPVLYSTRHIQQAVHIARRRHLVTPEVLAAAGFKAQP